MKSKKTIVGNIDPLALEFTAGEDCVLDLALVEVDCIGSAAHATMLSRMPGKEKVISAGDAKKIIRELVKIIRQARKGDFTITDRDQDVHLAVERVLTGKLGALGKRLHTGRSRNDQVATDLRLYGKEQLLLAIAGTAALAGTLLDFAEKNIDVPMVGRTHMQPAMPSSVGLWSSAHAESLLDDIVVLKNAYDINNASPLGSAAGYGVPLKINRALTARLLGFKGPVHNVLYASTARGKCEAVILSAMVQVMITLSRLSADLLLYTMPELNYFKLPDAFCTGSSIMPQKRNPDVLELVRAKSSTVQGYSSTVAGIISGLPAGYQRDLQETKGPYINGVDTTRFSLAVMTKLLSKLKVNESALLAGFTPEVFATDKALRMSLKGKPFRDAYNSVKKELSHAANEDAAEALKSRSHLGVGKGLDLGVLRSRLSDNVAFVRKEHSAYCGRISKLLGIKYS